MQYNSRFAQSLGLFALIMAIAGDVLFYRANQLAVNLSIWINVFIVIGFWLVKTHSAPATDDVPNKYTKYQSMIFAGFVLLFACIFCIRASGMLLVFDIWAIITGLMLTLLSINNIGVLQIGSFEITKAFVRSTLSCGFGGFMLFPLMDLDSANIPVLPLLGRILRGILLAAIPVSIFGMLLINADAVYSHYVVKLFNWDIEDILTQLSIIAGISWILLGVYWFAWSHKVAPYTENTSRMRLSWTDITAILGMIDFLFLTFVIVQVRYLFGGAASVKAVIGMTYSQYARQGFFELVWVAAIVTPLLLLLHWLRDTDKRTSTIYTLLSGIQIVLLFVIIASAVVRMLAYTAQYGLTELRVYPLVFMIWLSIVLVWFSVTVLRNKRQYFTIGAVISAFIIGAIVHFINPSNLIAQYNVDRSLSGKPFDACYAADLGSDAVPVLVDSLPKLTQKDKATIAYRLDHTYSKPNTDWRGWNYSDIQAYNIVDRNRLNLKALSSGVQKDPCSSGDVD